MTVEHCSGFVYATAVMGVTGARERDQRPRRAAGDAAPREVTDLPIGVGLGVSNGDQAAEVASLRRRRHRRLRVRARVLDAGGRAAALTVTELAAELAEGVRRA